MFNISVMYHKESLDCPSGVENFDCDSFEVSDNIVYFYRNRSSEDDFQVSEVFYHISLKDISYLNIYSFDERGFF